MNLYAMTAPVVGDGVLDGVPAIIGVSSPLATALAMVYLIFTGRLYVRSAHEAVVRVLENQLVAVTADGKSWREACVQKDSTIALQAATISELMESAKFSTHVMSALQDTANHPTTGSPS